MPDSLRKLIVQDLETSIEAVNGATGGYNNTLSTAQVKAGRLEHWNSCKEFPKVFILAGNEDIQHQPGYIERAIFNLSVIGYVQSPDNPWTSIEDLIFDLKKVIISDPERSSKANVTLIDRVTVIGTFEDTGKIMICNFSLVVIYFYHKDTPQTLQV